MLRDPARDEESVSVAHDVAARQQPLLGQDGGLAPPVLAGVQRDAQLAQEGAAALDGSEAEGYSRGQQFTNYRLHANEFCDIPLGRYLKHMRTRTYT